MSEETDYQWVDKAIKLTQDIVGHENFETINPFIEYQKQEKEVFKNCNPKPWFNDKLWFTQAHEKLKSLDDPSIIKDVRKLFRIAAKS